MQDRHITDSLFLGVEHQRQTIKKEKLWMGVVTHAFISSIQEAEDL